MVRMKLKSFLNIPYLIASFLTLFIIYYCYYYNVYEYALTVPFSKFKYPLEIDLKSVVNRLQNGETQVIQPLEEHHNYPYIMNSDLKCRDEEGNEDDVFLIVLIKSRLENFDQRNMIRRTWGRQFGTNHVNIRRVFLLGVNPNDKKLQQRIGIEQQDYDDIVQQFFVDHYFNNTLKMIMGFKWAVNFCKNARFVAFFDDDYYVNMKKVTELLNAVKKEDYDNTIVGMVWRNAMPYRIKNNKWYVSLDEYPYRFWPDYVTAGSFFVPMPTAERINLALQYVKLIRFDDVYLGIVAYKLDIKLQHSNNLVFYDMAYDKYKFRNIIAAHGFKDVEFLYKVWKEQRDIDAIS